LPNPFVEAAAGFTPEPAASFFLADLLICENLIARPYTLIADVYADWRLRGTRY